MVQGGDPTGTGKGGECIWGGKFEDEISDSLKHTGLFVMCSVFLFPPPHCHPALWIPQALGSSPWPTRVPTPMDRSSSSRWPPRPGWTVECAPHLPSLSSPAPPCTNKRTRTLVGKHTIFGRVSEGMENVKRLGLVQTDATDRPLDDISILRCRVK